MDVIFDTKRGGKQFSIEVGFFDTVKEIKEKIEKYQQIPISRQTLIFNGQVLQDDTDVAQCEILHNSKIHLAVSPPEFENQALVAKNLEDSCLSPSNKIQLNINIPSSGINLPLEMDPNDTVLRLKEKIQDMDSMPASRLVLHAAGTELQDNKSLRESQLSDNADIDVSVKASTAVSSGGVSGGGGGSKKLKLLVLPKSETKKIPVEVNASDNVGELRKELQRLHQKLHFHLPQEGYFFIYKQNVMDDDRSFRWHHVGQGDTIEIFNGSVTGGS